MIRVGITGGIGAGKTTFCRIWQQLGAFVVYADDFAKQLMISDKDLINEIKTRFGEDSYEADGNLNRKYLAEEAFAKGRVDELNAIVHPVLWSRISKLVHQKEEEGVKVFVKEAAILLQNGRPTDLDYVILLEAHQAKRIQRVVLRDNTSENFILDRISKQKSFEEVAHLADYIVSNNAAEKELMVQARELYNRLEPKN